MNLITAWEVVKYSSAERDYPTMYICSLIPIKEPSLFRACLGMDFYKELLGDVNDFSGVTEYVDTVTYSVGDLVLNGGCVLRSLQDNNLGNLFADDFADWWVEADKFKKECNNLLWNKYLRYYLAYEIFALSLRSATYKAGAKGLVEMVDDPTGIISAKKVTFSDYKRELQNLAQDILANMMDWISDSDCEFNIRVSGCGEKKCTTKKRGRVIWV